MNAIASTALVLGLAGLSPSHSSPLPVPDSSVPPCCATPEPDAPLDLDVVRALAGTWVAVDADGNPTDQVVSEAHVSAGGHAVLETLFPGADEEMLTLYYMDEGRLSLTHHCVLGNHPTMVAQREGDEVVFTCVDAGERCVAARRPLHMHEARFRWLADGRLATAWTSMEAGRLAGEPRRTVSARRD